MPPQCNTPLTIASTRLQKCATPRDGAPLATVLLTVLADAPAALAAVENGHTSGKVVIKVA
ncbi:hypothetical protein ACFV20_17470 [Streptomyces sp. NPDC059696]|uniref:hypothetical protein n=1 Tax=Streptomyces sp. NPDC059696 TaxID=3346911 RepID=UPI00369DA31B